VGHRPPPRSPRGLLPTPVTVAHLIDSLRALNEPPKRGQPPRIDDLEARLVAAIARDLTGLPVVDGYRTGRARPHPDLDDPDAVDEPTLTAVEAAVLARDQGPVRDRHHQLTVRAVHAIDEAVVAIQVVFAALKSIDELVGTGPPAPKTCDWCTGKRGEGNDRPIYVRGTVGDRLERALGLCNACHGFVCQTAAAGSRAGYLPNDAQIHDHELRGRWKIRALPHPRTT
jgi:hypothetical protein